jgi:serralysin
VAGFREGGLSSCTANLGQRRQRHLQVFSYDAANLVEDLRSKGSYLGWHETPEDAAQSDGAAWGEYIRTGEGWTRAGLQAGGYGFITLVHELGHGLGLAHTHDNGGGSAIFPGVSSAFGDFGDNNLNQGIFTTMSYNDGWQTGPSGLSPSNDYGWQSGPMAFDIAAIQYLYGANTTYHAGNDVYVLPDANAAGTFWSCIWDAGGTAAIVYSGLGNVLINLTAATLDNSPTGGGVPSYASGIHGGFTIANGVVIENAAGGSGNDTIVGNSADNELAGNIGNDFLNGGLGDDTLFGGSGTDLFVFWNAFGSDTITDYAFAGATHDVIDVSGLSLVSSFEDIMSHAQYNGQDTIFTFGSDILTLADVSDQDWASFTADDFKFGVVVTGTSNVDTIDGTHAPLGQPFPTDGSDTIYGLAGGDVIHGLAGNDSIEGGSGTDTLYGDEGNDTLIGGAGTDKLFGGSGEDSFVVSGSDDLLDIFDGGLGTDTIEVTGTGSVTLAGFNATASSIEAWQGNRQAVLGNSSANVFNFSGLTSVTGLGYVDAGSGNDKITGTGFADDLRGNAGTLTGGDGNDTLSGGADSDNLNGGGNNDTITGGAGKDILTGGDGSDTFVYSAIPDSTKSAQDTIKDFVEGVDKIDLHAIDANTTSLATGNQDFSFFGSSSTAVANQVTFSYSGGNTIVSADTNGNTTADLMIVLTGLHTLTANDFVL